MDTLIRKALLYLLALFLSVAGCEDLVHAQDSARVATTQAQPAPQPDGSLIEPITLEYETSVEAQGRQMSMSVRRTIEAATHEGRAVWKIVDRNTSGMTGGADTVMVDRQTLAPVQRSVAGQGRLMIAYTDTSVSGTMQARGRSVSIDASFEPPIFGNGPGLELALAALPLDSTYATALRVFNPTEQRVRTMTLEVTGTRTVQVPGGTFKAYVADLASEDGNQSETLYLKQSAPHHVVRGESDLPPQMGSGSATRVLTRMEAGVTSGGE